MLPALAGVALALLASLARAAPPDERLVNTALPPHIATNLGPYSPYRAVGTYRPPPADCSVTQVNILQRHGQRFPTSKAGEKIAKSVSKLQSAASLSPKLTFVHSYTYSLGADDLTPQGAVESHVAGQEAYSRYASLYPPFVRTDSSQRVFDSAGNWTAGFYLRRRVRDPPAALVISNAAGSNDTLDDNDCDAAPDLSSHKEDWLAIFAANATARLNTAAPGANIVLADTLNYMQLCGFETEYTGVLSNFCGLFTEKEWRGFEYYYDLDKYYGTGYGQPLGAIQGVGWVNELLSRLTGDRSYHSHDRTQVNHTLDDDPSTFALTYSLYADFTHDNQMTAILAALRLKNGSALRSNGPPAEGRAWVTSETVLFSGRLVTEKLKCADHRDYVRFFINDQLQVPIFCEGADATTGLCLLSSFVESQWYARDNGNGDFQKCGYTPSSLSQQQ
ncbi:hypothetical protein JCM10213_006087 [Rhodosporidiobolus nylandii]